MKSAIFAFLAAGLLFSGSFCSPESVDMATGKKQNSGLIGTWKQIASYYSIGDINIHWVTIPSDSAEIIRFQPGNIYSSNRQPGYNRYLIDSSAELTRLYVFTQGRSDTLRYYLRPVSADTIDISPPCIEACGNRYVRIAG